MAAAPKKIGFLADTHSRKPDGSDLPDQVLKAFKGVDLIVHLGDIGRHGILDRLGEIAPVWVPFGDNKGYVVRGSKDAPVKVVTSASGMRVGLCFNLAQPDKKIVVGDGSAPLDFGDTPLAAHLTKRFKEDVDIVAFGGTHRTYNVVHDRVLFVNPGSPTLPMEAPGTVAVLDVSTKKPKVKLVSL